jgi:ADP-ribose pyrophosphatase YjhB (NUDIX family)
MSYFSAHAVVIHQNKALFNQEHEDFGPLLPGGRFDKEDFGLIGKVREEDLSRNVVQRELKEELKPDIISLNQYLGCFSDDITTKSGKAYHIEKMYFWKVDIEPKELGTLQSRTPIPLMYLNSEEIKSKIRSPAMKQIVMEFLS